MFKFHDYSLVRLFSSSAQDIIGHITALSKEDRYLRFGHSASDENIVEYVNKTINKLFDQNNYWWGIYDEKKLVATIHVAAIDTVAEFAFTTDADYRGHKLGQLLFMRGIQFVTEFQIDRIYLVCLSQNLVMRHIAKKFGLTVMTHGSDSEASVLVEYPVPISKLHEIKMCIIDKDIVK